VTTQPLPNVSAQTARNRCARWTRLYEAASAKRNPNQRVLAKRRQSAEYWCWVEQELERQAAQQLVGSFESVRPSPAQPQASHMTSPPVRPQATHPAVVGTAVALVGLTVVGLGYALTR
jgi:hypothetical protein